MRRRLQIVVLVVAMVLAMGVGPPAGAARAGIFPPNTTSAGRIWCSLGGGFSFQFAGHDPGTTTTVRLGSANAGGFTPLPIPTQVFTSTEGSGEFPVILGTPPGSSWWTVQFEYTVAGEEWTTTSGNFFSQNCDGIEVFTDVTNDHRFAFSIGGFGDMGVMNAFPDGTFRPTAAMSRQAMAVILYRLQFLSGPHPPDCTSPPFTDVAVDDAVCPYVQWMSDHGIMHGFAGDTFRPTAPVTRQSGAAFLYRLHTNGFYYCTGAIPPQTDAGLSDVDALHPFHEQIWWAAHRTIVHAYPDNTFRPGASLTRQAAAAQLFKMVVLCVF